MHTYIERERRTRRAAAETHRTHASAHGLVSQRCLQGEDMYICIYMFSIDQYIDLLYRERDARTVPPLKQIGLTLP